MVNINNLFYRSEWSKTYHEAYSKDEKLQEKAYTQMCIWKARLRNYNTLTFYYFSSHFFSLGMLLDERVLDKLVTWISVTYIDVLGIYNKRFCICLMKYDPRS